MKEEARDLLRLFEALSLKTCICEMFSDYGGSYDCPRHGQVVLKAWRSQADGFAETISCDATKPVLPGSNQIVIESQTNNN